MKLLINTFITFFILIFLISPIKGFAVESVESEKGKEEEVKTLLFRLNSIKKNLNEIEEEKEKLKKLKDERYLKLEESLYEFEDLSAYGISSENFFYPTCKTNFTKDELNKALEGTGLEGLGEAFSYVEEEYGVNSILFMAMANHESDHGNSRIAKDKNNLFGIMAIDSDPYNSAKSYSSKEECIIEFGKFLSEKYLNEDGEHYNGMHTYGINQKYASDPNWGDKVNSHMRVIARKMIRNKY